jgi:hypothetical protein
MKQRSPHQFADVVSFRVVIPGSYIPGATRVMKGQIENRKGRGLSDHS